MIICPLMHGATEAWGNALSSSATSNQGGPGTSSRPWQPRLRPEEEQLDNVDVESLLELAQQLHTTITCSGNQTTSAIPQTGDHPEPAAPEPCAVCGQPAGKHSYYGGQVCVNCRAFFRYKLEYLEGSKV